MAKELIKKSTFTIFGEKEDAFKKAVAKLRKFIDRQPKRATTLCIVIGSVGEESTS